MGVPLILTEVVLVEVVENAVLATSDEVTSRGNEDDAGGAKVLVLSCLTVLRRNFIPALKIAERAPVSITASGLAHNRARGHTSGCTRPKEISLRPVCTDNLIRAISQSVGEAG